MSQNRSWDLEEDQELNEPASQDAPTNLVHLPVIGKPKDLVALHNSCPACGSNLHMIHVTDFVRNLTQETAKCPECGIQTRKVVHQLQ